MDQREIRPMVLACIPDLHITSDADASSGLPGSRGRVIGQSLSFKLLMATIAFLVVAAILPFVLGTRDQSPDPSSVANALSPNNPAPSAPSVNTAGARPVRVVQAAAAGPTLASPPRTPGVLPQPEVKSAPPPPLPAGAPLMSQWPNPAMAARQTEPSANQAMTIHRPEYEADARAGRQGADPGATRFDGTNQQPVIRNGYDRTRPSVH
jgi:hypothetical protein